MPRGTYHLTGRSRGRQERFSCAPGPAGWRYVCDTLDLACDNAFRAVRFVVTAPDGDPAVQVRGGGLRLDDGAPVLVWSTTSGGAQGPERTTAASGLLTPSPGSVVALLRSVAGPGEDPASGDLDVLRFGVDDVSGALTGLRVRLRVARSGAARHDAPDGVLLAETWTVADADTALTSQVHLAGDVVLHATAGVLDDEVELAELDGPPWTGRQSG